MRGDGRVFERNGIYYISYYFRGAEKRESLNSEYAKRLGLNPDNPKHAEKFLKHRRDQVIGERHGGKKFVGPSQEKVMVNELLDDLIENYRKRGKATEHFLYHLKPVRDTFGDWRAVDCTEERIDRVISEWRNVGRGEKLRKISGGTVNREIGILGQALRLAVKHKKISTAPEIEKLGEGKRDGFFERHEFEAMVKHLPEDLQDFTRFAYLTGWRKGEIASLQWSDVDLQGRIIRLKGEKSKNREPRKTALEGEVWEVIQRRLSFKEVITNTGVKTNTLVFHRENGEPVKSFRKAWAEACKLAKVEGKVFHDLRRTAVRNMVRAGIPESVAMRISGHKTRSVFLRYDIVSENDLREAVKRSDSYVKSLPDKDPQKREHGQNTSSEA